MITNGSRNYISENVYTLLCSEGKRLYETWQNAVDMQADKTIIYETMKAYFKHRNGNDRYGGSYCQVCTGYTSERE